MKDPLTALMYAVQVMKLLKCLTEKALREREVTSPPVDTRSSNEAEDGEKEVDNEEEDEEEEEGDGDGDGVYIIEEVDSEAEGGEKEVDKEEEEEEEEEEQDGDGVYIIEEEALQITRVVADDHKSESMKSAYDGSITSDSKGVDGVVQPLICNPDHIGNK